MTMFIRPAFKMFGGKRYLASWIVNHFPDHHIYIEPFCGAANVLLNKPISSEEIINDLDNKTTLILKIIRDQPKEFVNYLSKINYSEENFQKALVKTDFKNEMEIALNEFVLRRMSRCGLKKAFSWSDRQRGGKPGDVNAWETIIDYLPIISKRLENVYIFNKKAIEIIRAYNEKDVLCYCDPTYLPETRVSSNTYEYEMTEKDHIVLSDVLKSFRGKVVLSGYNSTLYQELYKEWRLETKKIVNHASQKNKKEVKEECLWLNY